MLRYGSQCLETLVASRAVVSCIAVGRGPEVSDKSSCFVERLTVQEVSLYSSGVVRISYMQRGFGQMNNSASAL